MFRHVQVENITGRGYLYVRGARTLARARTIDKIGRVLEVVVEKGVRWMVGSGIEIMH